MNPLCVWRCFFDLHVLNLHDAPLCERLVNRPPPTHTSILLTQGRDSLLLLLRFLLGLLRVGDDEVNGILWLLQQNSQFRFDLLSPETRAEGYSLLSNLNFE